VTIAWLQLVGAPYLSLDFEKGINEFDFPGVVQTKAMEALGRLEAKLLPAYDGAAWLAQGGYEKVALELEYRAVKRGRALRRVPSIGRLLTPDYSVVCPELPELSVEEMVEYFDPVVLEALAMVGERKKLGLLPLAGEGDHLVAIPLLPLQS
jgi:hypothetical protein